MEKLKDLMEKFDSVGEFPVIVVDKSYLFEDSYAENNMIGVFKGYSISNEPVYDENEGRVVHVFIDWSEYGEHNEKFESHDWYVTKPDGERALGTMKEAGMFPKDGIEEMYLMEKLPSGLALKEENNLFNEWKNENSDVPYVVWLENKILESRKGE